MLRLIQRVIDAAHAAGKWVGMCGDMAADPLAVPLLLGVGLDGFSVPAGAVLEVQDTIRRTPMTGSL